MVLMALLCVAGAMSIRDRVMLRSVLAVAANTALVYAWNRHGDLLGYLNIHAANYGDPRAYLFFDIITAAVIIRHPSGRVQFMAFGIYMMQCAMHVACIAFLYQYKGNATAIAAGWSIYLDILTVSFGGQIAVLLGGTGYERGRRVVSLWRAFLGGRLPVAVGGQSMGAT